MASIRRATEGDDDFIADAFRRMWLDIGMTEDGIAPDAQARTLAFITDARDRLDFRAFVAEADEGPIGCAAAQKFAGLYPDVLSPKVRRYGYIWGVYVAPEHRRGGLGEQLTRHCIESMRGTYSHVLLHAAPMGRAIYDRLGFVGTTELKLEL